MIVREKWERSDHFASYFKKLLNIYLLNYNFEFEDFVLLKSTSVKKNTNIDDLICSIAKYTHFAYVLLKLFIRGLCYQNQHPRLKKKCISRFQKRYIL